MSSRKLRFTSEARFDIRAILRYGRKIWGEKRRDAYSEQLNAAIASLTRFPNLGTNRDDISPGLRSIPVGEHVVYYRIGPHSIVIIRILHGTMDVARQFER
jgi:toxin ParE1/3/4